MAFFGEVAAVIIWWHELKNNVGRCDFVAIKSRDFVVEDLVLRLDALVFHPCEGAATCQNHLPLCLFFIGSAQVELLSMSWRSI